MLLFHYTNKKCSVFDHCCTFSRAPKVDKILQYLLNVLRACKSINEQNISLYNIVIFNIKERAHRKQQKVGKTVARMFALGQV